MPAPARHSLTVHLEDHFQVGVLNTVILRNLGQRLESRIAVTTDRPLDPLARHSTRAPCFARSWVAGQFPAVAREVADTGWAWAVRAVACATHGPFTRTRPEVDNADDRLPGAVDGRGRVPVPPWDGRDTDPAEGGAE